MNGCDDARNVGSTELLSGLWLGLPRAGAGAPRLRRWMLGALCGVVAALAWPAATAAAQGWGEPSRDDGWGRDARDRPEPPRDVYDSRPRYDRWDERYGFGFRMGLGFTSDPTSFLIDLALPYSTGGGVSFGPRVQLGFADERSLIAPTLAFEYVHDWGDLVSGPMSRVRPLITAGIGLMWLEKEGRSGDNDDAGFLVDVGLGAEFALSERFALASVIDFNLMPEDVLDENLIFAWQVLQLRLHF